MLVWNRNWHWTLTIDHTVVNYRTSHTFLTVVARACLLCDVTASRGRVFTERCVMIGVWGAWRHSRDRRVHVIPASCWSIHVTLLPSLTVHPSSFSSKAVLAVSPVVSATPYSDYSQAVTSSAPFLGLLVSGNSMIQRRITFTFHIHSVLIHSRSGGRCF
jgi:hypothetical protein